MNLFLNDMSVIIYAFFITLRGGKEKAIDSSPEQRLGN
jgi:hypothetical protein